MCDSSLQTDSNPRSKASRNRTNPKSGNETNPMMSIIYEWETNVALFMRAIIKIKSEATEKREKTRSKILRALL